MPQADLQSSKLKLHIVCRSRAVLGHGAWRGEQVDTISGNREAVWGGWVVPSTASQKLKPELSKDAGPHMEWRLYMEKLREEAGH